MEPHTDLEAVLTSLEWVHLDPGRSTVPPARLIAPDFTEVGASGRRIERDEALQILSQRAIQDAGRGVLLEAVRVIPLDVTVFLLTYDLHAAGGLTRRTSIWRHEHGEWQILFHQGTPAQTEPRDVAPLETDSGP